MTQLLITLQDVNNGLSSILMIVALIAIFYFMMIRPQQKQQKKIREFRAGVQKGDNVITAGGIHGKVVEVKDTYFVLSIADNVKIRIDKNSVYPSAEDAQQDASNQQK